MHFSYLGDDQNFLRNAYFDGNGNNSAAVQSFGTTSVVLFNPATNVTTTVAGTGFTVNASLEITSGTISSISMNRGAMDLGEITQINWSAVSFDAAIDAIEASNDYGPLGTLINQSAAVTIDATASLVAVQDYSSTSPWGRLTEFVTSPITNLDSQFSDRILPAWETIRRSFNLRAATLRTTSTKPQLATIFSIFLLPVPDHMRSSIMKIL